MKIKNNNIVFNIWDQKYNVPLAFPWEAYEGDTKQMPVYFQCIEENCHKADDKTFTLHVTEKCNLSCKYCLYGEKGKDTITEAVIDQFIEYIKRHNYRRITILFFGGEPLVAIDKIRYTVEKLEALKSVKSQYSIFTNGLLLDDEIVLFLEKYNFGMYLSLDGTEDMHDKNRIYANGCGSYWDVINTIKPYKELLTTTFVRAVYDTESCSESLVSIGESLYKNGFGFYQIKLPAVEKNSGYALNDEKVKKILKMIDEFGLEAIRRIKENDFSLAFYFDIFQIVFRMLTKSSLLSETGCGVGKNLAAIDIKGNIYPCQNFTGIQQFKMGNIYDDITCEKMSKIFKYFSYDTVNICNECAAKYLCPDYCPYEFAIYNGDIHQPNLLKCEITKEIFKVAVYMYMELKKMPSKIEKLKVFYYQYSLRPW